MAKLLHLFIDKTNSQCNIKRGFYICTEISTEIKLKLECVSKRGVANSKAKRLMNDNKILINRRRSFNIVSYLNPQIVADYINRVLENHLADCWIDFYLNGVSENMAQENVLSDITDSYLGDHSS